jgi:uncharacterized protein
VKRPVFRTGADALASWNPGLVQVEGLLGRLAARRSLAAPGSVQARGRLGGVDERIPQCPRRLRMVLLRRPGGQDPNVMREAYKPRTSYPMDSTPPPPPASGGLPHRAGGFQMKHLAAITGALVTVVAVYVEMRATLASLGTEIAEMDKRLTESLEAHRQWHRTQIGGPSSEGQPDPFEASVESYDATDEEQKSLGDVSDERLSSMCEKGNRGACYTLGVRADGVKPAQAKQYYATACQAKSSAACMRLGWLLERGDQLEQDLPSAALRYEQACNLRSAVGCYHLALLLGRHRDLDAEQSIPELLGAACAGGQGRACNDLGLALQHGTQGFAASASKAASHYEMACDLGNADGCSNLGFLYSSGRGVARNDSAATDYYRKACTMRSATACFNLGTLYSLGRAQDGRGSAAGYFGKACGLGHPQACDKLGE